jgi:hypothetical protein
MTDLILSKLNVSDRKTDLGLGKERTETWFGLENRKKENLSIYYCGPLLTVLIFLFYVTQPSIVKVMLS